MSDIILKVENLSKQYRLGTIGTGTISHDLNRWFAKIRGKEDPFLKIGETNDRSTKGKSQYVWALKDINFEVKRGEVLGIIGKNGAGKSTLLKILSKVTNPTTGSIKTKGRIASLLEVGTGFHPEMTGRENIFLNGAILGMTKSEIRSKLDEIVAFSGCERYIDTPVKRYSSGMKVRLAFAVAAHLEPDILVVDEVLAVGDAEFQKKAIGKMQDISNTDGRTVLFVSHDMGTINNLCNCLILVEKGNISFSGSVEEGISRYLRSDSLLDKNTYKIGSNWIEEVIIKDADNFISGNNIELNMKFKISSPLFSPYLSFILRNERGEIVAQFHSRATVFNFEFKNDFTLKLVVEKLNLHLGEYRLDFNFYDGKKYQFSNVALINCVKVSAETNKYHKLKNNFFFNYSFSKQLT